MPRAQMAIFGSGLTEILHDIDADRARTPSRMALLLDIADEVPQRHFFPVADLLQRLPELGFETHARAPSGGDNIAVHKPAHGHGRSPSCWVPTYGTTIALKERCHEFWKCGSPV